MFILCGDKMYVIRNRRERDTPPIMYIVCLFFTFIGFIIFVMQ